MLEYKIFRLVSDEVSIVLTAFIILLAYVNLFKLSVMLSLHNLLALIRSKAI